MKFGRNVVKEGTTQKNYHDEDKKYAINIINSQFKGLVVWGLWQINHCRLFNAKSFFMQILLFQTIRFSKSTQFNSQKHYYFKLFSLFKQS